MNILFIGDIVGKLGRKAVAGLFDELVEAYNIDFAIANVENIAHGTGVTEKTLQEMADVGVQCFTSGNHIWRNKAVFELFEENKFPLVRPANYPEGTAGCGYLSFNISQKKIYVLNLQGRVFMNELVDDPFRSFDTFYTTVKPSTDDIVLVDFHAEATSEKKAFGYYVDGKASAVIGTHTHVQTNDARILPGGTGYVTDAGCVAGRNTVLGVAQDDIITALTTSMPQKHTYPETGEAELSAVVLSFSEKSRLENITTINKTININN